MTLAFSELGIWRKLCPKSKQTYGLNIWTCRAKLVKVTNKGDMKITTTKPVQMNDFNIYYGLESADVNKQIKNSNLV